MSSDAITLESRPLALCVCKFHCTGQASHAPAPHNAHGLQSCLALLQVSEQAAQALNLRDVLDNSAALEDGGPLYFDGAHGVWQYEGSALLGQLQTTAQVRFAPSAV